MVKCPFCKLESEHKLLKMWRYRFWNVHLYECSQCHRKFRYQVDPTGKHKSFTMGLIKRERSKE